MIYCIVIDLPEFLCPRSNVLQSKINEGCFVTVLWTQNFLARPINRSQFMERKRKANIIVPFTSIQRTKDNRYVILTLQHFQNRLFPFLDFGIFPLSLAHCSLEWTRQVTSRLRHELECLSRKTMSVFIFLFCYLVCLFIWSICWSAWIWESRDILTIVRLWIVQSKTVATVCFRDLNLLGRVYTRVKILLWLG